MLKAIEIVGFKSVAARTRLEFGDGIMAIVGPNGSRKSNVVDAIKFERFIFDLLPLAKNAVIVEVDVFNHHAVLKNATGSHSPETVKRDISARHTAWLRQAGAVVLESTPIEISPLFADSSEVVEKVERGQQFERAIYLQ